MTVFSKHLAGECLGSKSGIGMGVVWGGGSLPMCSICIQGQN